MKVGSLLIFTAVDVEVEHLCIVLLIDRTRFDFARVQQHLLCTECLCCYLSIYSHEFP